MTKNKIQSIKGTYDLLPQEISKWQYVENKLREIFTLYNFFEIRTPIFEKSTLFSRSVGELTDIVNKEMYTFQDKGKNFLTLRPELTASIVRAFIQHNFQQISSIHKLWYYGPLFRQEKPQAGRYRQFSQFGSEIFGSAYPESDVELIDMAYTIYQKLGLKNFKLYINSLGGNESRNEYIKTLKSKLLPHKENLCKTCQTRFDNNTLRLFDCKNRDCKKVMKEHAPLIIEHLSEPEREYFEEVKSLLDELKIEYEVDPRMVRGLDYYTNTIFEIRSENLGSQDALCGGGRYNNLIEELGGKSTPAIGFAGGMERLIISMESENLFSDKSKKLDIFIAPMNDNVRIEAIKIAKTIRENGHSVDMDFQRRSVKAMMREANRKNAKYSVVIGENELQSKQLNVKNMDTGETKSISIEKINEFLSA
ncbi:MAG: histidine--tRNA ligase [Candidatus Marinimicrobia bacterium]|nr:histidine--tRNA ligase [Candidatus Neomarinimicrobiota bacterium]